MLDNSRKRKIATTIKKENKKFVYTCKTKKKTFDMDCSYERDRYWKKKEKAIAKVYIQ